MSRYFDEMRKAVERHGGRVEKFIGDAVWRIGVPQLHEDDALRAVRAAAEMRSRLQDLNVSLRSEWGVELQSRIGVCTGEVVVGRGDGALLGDVMNTAARLQTAAGPGEVLLADATWRRVRDAVAADPVAPVVAKGKAEPVVARRWCRYVARRNAGQRRSSGGIDSELLTEALQDATDAQAGVLATILAPPGVGKSRLAEAFTQSLGERASVLVGQTPSYGEGVTFAPLVEILRTRPACPRETPRRWPHRSRTGWRRSPTAPRLEPGWRGFWVWARRSVPTLRGRCGGCSRCSRRSGHWW